MSRAVAALGDAALLLPASVLLLVWLCWLRQGWTALAWAIALALCGGVTVALKLAFRTCGPSLTDLDVVSPSGHASFATLFYGALVVLLAAGRPRRQGLALGAAALALVLLIGASRVRTGAHTPAEVAIGLGIGTASLALLVVLHGRAGRPAIAPAPLALGFAVLVLLLGGAHLSLEEPIAALARRLSAAFDVCA